MKLEEVNFVNLNSVNELIDKIREAKMKMIEHGMVDIILTTSNENVQYIHEYYQSELGFHEISGVYGMRLNVSNLPKDITFILTEDKELVRLKEVERKYKAIEQRIVGYLAGRDIEAHELITELLEYI